MSGLRQKTFTPIPQPTLEFRSELYSVSLVPYLPAASSRSAITVGLSRFDFQHGLGAVGDLTGTIGCRERHLEAVWNLLQAVVVR